MFSFMFDYILLFTILICCLIGWVWLKYFIRPKKQREHYLNVINSYNYNAIELDTSNNLVDFDSIDKRNLSNLKTKKQKIKYIINKSLNKHGYVSIELINLHVYNNKANDFQITYIKEIMRKHNKVNK